MVRGATTSLKHRCQFNLLDKERGKEVRERLRPSLTLLINYNTANILSSERGRGCRGGEAPS
jgi:hypothetical protein